MREELERLLAADPFVPFQIMMSSGHGYIVRHPGLAMMGGDILYLMQLEPDTHSVLRLVQIASVDMIV